MNEAPNVQRKPLKDFVSSQILLRPKVIKYEPEFALTDITYCYTIIIPTKYILKSIFAKTFLKQDATNTLKISVN